MEDHDVQRSTIRVSVVEKDFFEEIKQDIAWIVRTRVNGFEAFTLWFRLTTGDYDSTPIVWNEKILLFENSCDLMHFVMSENSSNMKLSEFHTKIPIAEPSQVLAQKIERKFSLEIHNFNLDITRKLLKTKNWESLNLKQLDFILNNLNMLTDFINKAEINVDVLESFLDYITFIVNSERKQLNGFDKKFIRRTVKSLVNALIRDSLTVSRTSRFTAST